MCVAAAESLAADGVAVGAPDGTPVGVPVGDAVGDDDGAAAGLVLVASVAPPLYVVWCEETN